jgi:hypothetical protein
LIGVPQSMSAIAPIATRFRNVVTRRDVPTGDITGLA